MTIYSLDVLLFLLEPVCCSMSSSNCCFLTCIQISQEAGQVVWFSHLSEFSTVYCDPHSQRLWHSLQCRRPGFNPWVKKISWSRKWQPTQVFLSGKSHGQRNLVGYSPWGCKESDPTEQGHTPKGQRRVISGKGRTFLALNHLVLLQKQGFLVSHYLSETWNDFTRNITSGMTRKNYL